MSHIQCQMVVPGNKFEVYEYVTKPENLAQLLKGYLKVKWLNPGIEMQPEAEFLFTMSRFGVDQAVRFRVTKFVLGNQISYHQIEGLFASWMHTMKFEEHGEGETLITDLVDYEVPFGFMGRVADDVWLRNDLKNILISRLGQAKERFSKIEVEATA